MKTIKSKMLVSILLILVLALGSVGGISIFMNYQSTVNSLEQTLSESVKIAVNQVDAKLEQYRTLATELAAQEKVVEGTAQTLLPEMAAIARRHGATTVGRTNAAGFAIGGTEDLSDREYFIQARDTGKAYVADPVVSREDGSLTLIISAPIMKDNRFDGIIYIGMDAQFLCDIVANIEMGETGNAAILDREGTTLAYADLQTVLDRYNTQNEVKKDPGLKRLAALEREMMAGNSGFGEYSYGGKEKFFAYAPIPNTNGWSMDVSVVQKEFMQGTTTAIILVLAAMAVCLLIAVFLVFWLANSVSNPIRLCMERILLLSKGDLATPVPEINTKDETKQLADATTSIVHTMSGIIQDISWGLGEMANGNFTIDSRCKELYVGDFQPIARSMYKILYQLSNTLLQINQSAEQVASGSDQVAAGAQALSQGATEQASSVQELAATINEISVHVKRNADNAQQASARVMSVGDVANESNKRMQDMLSAMNEISSSSDEISKIIKTIEDIAFQTNILALNAAVEAARAGSAGKGFAVVADEVRNLASKSSVASKDTAALIEGSLKSVENGRQLADETAQSLIQVVNGVNEVADTIKEISEASGEQSSSIEQVTLGIDQISSVVQTNSATSEQSAAASEELSGQAQMLKQLVGEFDLRSEEELNKIASPRME